MLVVGIAHDGASQNQARTAADRLHHPADDQLPDGPCKGAEQGSQKKQHYPGQQHRAAPETIRKGAHEELRNGDTHQVERQGELDRRHVGVEHRLHAGHRRHEDVERQGAEGGDGDQDAKRRPAPTRGLGGRRLSQSLHRAAMVAAAAHGLPVSQDPPGLPCRAPGRRPE